MMLLALCDISLLKYANVQSLECIDTLMLLPGNHVVEEVQRLWCVFFLEMAAYVG